MIIDKEEADRLIEKAKLCLRSGRKEKALQLLYEAQKVHPSTRARGKISFRPYTLSDLHLFYFPATQQLMSNIAQTCAMWENNM